MCSAVQLVITHLPKDVSNQTKVKEMWCEWELISAEKKNKNSEKEAGIFAFCHLAQIFARCRKGNAIKTPHKHVKGV